MRRRTSILIQPPVRLIAGLILFPLLICSVPAFAGQKSGKNMPRSEKHEGRHEIFQLEDRWRQAVLKGDTATMDALLAPDYVAIMSNGTLSTKEQTLAQIRSGSWHLTSLNVTERKIRFYGSTALLTCRVEVTGTLAQQDVTGNYRYTRVYNRDAKGNWKIVNFEANRIHGDSDSAENK